MAIDYSSYKLLDDVALYEVVSDRLYDDYADWCDAHRRPDDEKSQAEFLAQYGGAPEKA